MAVLGRWTAMSLVALATGACTAVALGAHAGGDDAATNREAARFAAHAVRLLAENRYAEAWEVLLPAHQRVVSRPDYAECERTSLIPGNVRSLTVAWVADESVAVAGLPGQTATKAVAVRLVITDAVVPEGVVIEHVVHVVRSGAGWAWILPAARYDSYRAGACAK